MHKPSSDVIKPVSFADVSWSKSCFFQYHRLNFFCSWDNRPMLGLRDGITKKNRKKRKGNDDMCFPQHLSHSISPRSLSLRIRLRGPLTSRASLMSTSVLTKPSSSCRQTSTVRSSVPSLMRSATSMLLCLRPILPFTLKSLSNTWLMLKFHPPSPRWVLDNRVARLWSEPCVCCRFAPVQH